MMTPHDTHMFTFCFIQCRLPHPTSIRQEEQSVGLPPVSVMSLSSAMDHLQHVLTTSMFRLVFHVTQISGSVSMEHVLISLSSVEVYLVKVFITA